MPAQTTMKPVLVAWASKHGSTAEIADRISRAIQAAGCPAESRPAAGVDDVTRYRAVILGSAVYMLRWRGEARRFARRHRRALRAMPLWLFSSGPTGAVDEHPQAPTPRAARSLTRKLGARGHVMLGGRLPEHPHGFVEEAMVRDTPVERRDARDWPAIEAWARQVATELETQAPVPVPAR